VGASPLFSPRDAAQETATEALLHVLRRDRQQCGLQSSRWQLAELVDCCKWLNLQTESGMKQRLERGGISYKRGREHGHSPDPCSQAKLDLIHGRRKSIQQRGDEEVVLSLDELTDFAAATPGQSL
jgi:hypothetical protein